MRKRGEVLSFDSRDLMRSQCSHCTRLSMAREHKLSGVEELVNQFYKAPDNLAIRFGIRYESQLEAELAFNLGEQFKAPATNTPDATLELMDAGVPVIYQGSVFGGSGECPFSGRPDFLVRGDYQLLFGPDGLTAIKTEHAFDGYTAWDAKLSTNPKPEYQNQVALYLDVLSQFGLASSNQNGLILGSRELVGFGSDVLLAGLDEPRRKLFGQMQQFIGSGYESVIDLGELICDASSYCELCEYPLLCQHEREVRNHLQLVAGITKSQIDSLASEGIRTVAALSQFEGSTEKLSPETAGKLALQARLQQNYYDTGRHSHVVIDSQPLRMLPDENPGDIFFDLEGFTFFEKPGGLEYLFGYTSIDDGERFHFEWSDDRDQEKQAFESFMREVARRQEKYPGSKIYHYANYEQAALKRLSQRFGSYQSEVLELLETGVFVDLYKVVKASIVISQPSYSIKKLEPLFGFTRSSDVKEAMGSMEYYDQYLELLADDYPEAEKLKRQVIAYNQEDCASTLALYRWLKSL